MRTDGYTVNKAWLDDIDSAVSVEGVLGVVDLSLKLRLASNDKIILRLALVEKCTAEADLTGQDLCKVVFGDELYLLLLFDVAPQPVRPEPSRIHGVGDGCRRLALVL